MSEPLILTAHVLTEDMDVFDALRRRHFPVERNFLRAHLTIFHHLPPEHRPVIDTLLQAAVKDERCMRAEIAGVRHLGAGVAFTVTSQALQDVRTTLAKELEPWLTRQDRRKWQPHITVQNKVSKPEADALFHDLSSSFSAHSISITGLDLWAYLGGPWRFEAHFPFKTS